MRRRHPLVLAFAATTVLLLSACASTAPAPAGTLGAAGSSGGSAAPSITPATQLHTACQLLTLQEAEAIVGTTLTAGVEGDPQDPSCSFEPDPKGTRTAQVRVLAGDGAKKTFDIDTTLKHTFTDVPGIGDEAHQEDFAIFFHKGSIWAGITCVLLDDPSKVESQMQDAAKLVASRLP